jgi:hypothetical protein
MRTWVTPPKPFHFLSTQVCADITVALPAYVRQLAGEVIIANERDAFAKLERRSPAERAAGLLALRALLPENDHLVERCFAFAMDDPSELVRGTAWCLVAELWRERCQLDVLRRVTRPNLVKRFQIAEPAITDIIVDMWLDGVKGFVDGELGAQKRARFDDALLQKMAGSDLKAIENSPEAAKDFLRHPNPRRRTAALMVMWHKTKEKFNLAGIFEDKLLSDPDADVRITALRYLIQVYSTTRESRVEKLLASLVKDESCPLQLRDIAYQGLFQIHDMPVNDWPITKWCQGRFRFPDDVDWGLVDAFHRVE